MLPFLNPLSTSFSFSAPAIEGLPRNPVDPPKNAIIYLLS